MNRLSTFGMRPLKQLQSEGFDIDEEYYNTIADIRKVARDTDYELVKAFAEFANENEPKCRPKSYPINGKKIIEWIDSQQTEEARLIASLITRLVKHVSYDEWYGVIVKLCAEIISYIKENKFQYVAMVIPGSFKKSNTYVAILMFKMLEPYIDIITNAAVGMGMFSNPEYGVYKTLFIHVDDCTYTGTQILENARFLKYNFEKVPEGIITYIIACAYIGSTAREKFNRYFPPYVKVLRSSVGFNTMYEDINKILLTEPRYASLKGDNGEFSPSIEPRERWDLGKNKSIIYFDHKLADTLSVYLYLLCLGTVIGSKDNLGSLISGCENNKYFAHGREIKDPEDTNAPEFTQNKMCPETIYKKIDYTFRGVPLVVDPSYPSYITIILHKIIATDKKI